MVFSVWDEAKLKLSPTEGDLTWGAIVLAPRQRGPFVFIKESTNWRIGEWRVRHAAQVSPPLQSDYDRVLELHLAPLRIKMDELREENAQLKGIISTFEQQKTPVLSLQAVAQEIVADGPETAERREWELRARQLGIPALLAEFRGLAPAKPVAHKQATTARLQGAISIPELSLSAITPKKVNVGKSRIDELVTHLNHSGIEAKATEFIFADLTKTADFGALGSTWGGKDLRRFKIFCDVERKFEEVYHYAEQARRNAGCVTMKLILKNDGEVAIESLKIGIQVAVTSVGNLINDLPEVDEYVPPRSPYDSSFDYARLARDAARVHRVEGGIKVGSWDEKLPLLRPKEHFEIKVPFRALRNGDINLLINIKATNLTQPFEQTIPYQVRLR